jgi:hypothetical protein
MARDRRVTLAGCGLEAGPVEDRNVAVDVLDQTGFCSVPATTVTVGRVEPSIIARNS